MNFKYQDLNGITHDLMITAHDHLVGIVYTIHSDGIFFCELVKGSDDIWREVWDGVTSRATEYGSFIDKTQSSESI